MKCSHCGNEFADGMAVCPICGAPSAYGASYTAQAAPPRPPYPTSVEIIKQTAYHKLYLAATILLTIHTAITALFYSNFDAISILLTIGAWMFYAEAHKQNADPYSMSLSSLKVLKATKTVSLVAWWIVAVCSAIAFISLVALSFFIRDGLSYLRSSMSDFSMDYYSYGVDINSILNAYEQFAPLFLVLFVAIVALALTFSYIYIICLRNYYKHAIESAETGLRPKKLSGVAPILMIISASLNLLSGITSVLYNPVQFISVTSYALSMIFFAVILMDARKRSDEAYYPNEAEVYYNKAAYYQYFNAQNYGVFGGYAYTDPSYMGDQYAQPPSQTPYNEQPQQPDNNQSQQ